MAACPIRRYFAAFAVLFCLAAPSARAACGDGVIDVDEECDDGSQNGSTNSCCLDTCKLSGKSPDVIVGDLVGTTRHGNVGGITAYSIGTTSCNLGSCWLNWFSGTMEHPVIGQNMFRLKDGRFEQIGQSWLKHGFTALAGSVCSSSCNAPPNGQHLGVNCSDPYSSSLNGSQTRLGPKQDVDPDLGTFPYPDSRIGTTGNAIFKRLQVHDVDLDPALNAGALYFVEGQYVTHDDATAKNQENNASWRRVLVGGAPSYDLTLTGTTQREKLGIQAWKANDPTVVESIALVPGGTFAVSAKATYLGGGTWHYEYAVQNFTNQRAGQSFTVPIPAGTVITNVGFHDVDYHSGEPFSGTDWTPTVGSNSVSWATQTYAQNPNANALRWGTLYNFRFDANTGPGYVSSVVIGLFRPGSPASTSFVTVTPGPCVGLANGSGCSDDDACTQSDSCQSGVCAGSNPVVCSALDACHTVGTCDSATGACSNPPVADGFPCADGNACTQTDVCLSGACTGTNPVVCAALDACHDVGTCSTSTGICSNPPMPDGTACTDADACTRTDSCQSGVCAGADPVICSALDPCHDVGTCSPSTGVCSDPPKANGTGCNDANACTTGDACTDGVCAGVGDPLPQTVDDSVRASQGGGITTLTWTPAPDSTESSVLRGLLSGLPVGPGGGDEVCLASGIPNGTTTDSEDPLPDEAFWYLVRGTSVCGNGPYGDAVRDGVPEARSSATCP